MGRLAKFIGKVALKVLPSVLKAVARHNKIDPAIVDAVTAAMDGADMPSKK